MPFADQFFDAAMAFATIDHWQDPFAGLREMRRVARRVVVFTKDFSDPDLFRLDRDYLPERAGLLGQSRAGRRAAGSAQLRADLASGRWAERDRDLVALDAAELGGRLLIV